MSPAADPSPVSLEGTLERVLFTSEDENFVVASVRVDGGGVERVVGRLAGLHEGERLRAEGAWRLDARHGRQFRAEAAWPVLPHTREGVLEYLAGGRINGVGKGLARRLVDAFGEETLDVIGNDPERLATVPGIGPKRSEELRRAFTEQVAQREAMVYLHGLGLKPGLASRIWRRLEGRTIPTIRENPYRLAEEVRGIGFRTADGMARHLGFAPDSPLRAAAALAHVLAGAADEGHVFLPRAGLLERAAALLGEGEVAERVLDTLLAEGRLVDGGAGRIYLRRMFAGEEEAAERTLELLAAPVPRLDLDLSAMQRETGITLAPAQIEAIRLAAESGFMALTGGPGTGKTTIIRALLHLFSEGGLRVALAAPTGRAARRMAEATGQEARTLHRLLEFSPAEYAFRRGPDAPLPVDAVIVDEASMVDQELYVALLRAVVPGTRLVWVGDADQLPSVGAGNVLDDLLAVEAVPAVRLTEIFRQAQQSRIITGAHAVLHGRIPLPGPADADFHVVEADGRDAAALVESLVVDRIPKAFGLDPVDDVQVLAPMHRGDCGTEALNARLQARLNADAPELVMGARRFRLGDKVMQVRNDYEREVFNGETGRVVRLDAEGLVVSFDGRPVAYPKGGLDALVIAYACTVHKSQGSEYPAVVIPVLGEHWLMLQRTLLYTAMTRGRRLVVLVAQRRALRRAVHNAEAVRRHTGLTERLEGTR